MVTTFCILEDFENALPRLIIYCSNTEDDGEINFIAYQSLSRLISVFLSNVLHCMYDVSVVHRCTLYLNKILFTLKSDKLLMCPRKVMVVKLI